MDLKKIIKRIVWKRLIIGVLLGAVLGYAYYYFKGCKSGMCAIQSDPINMTLYGALLGAILFFKIEKDPS